MDIQTNNPKLDDGFRFLTIVYNEFSRQYEYRICDYCQSKRKWRKVGNLEDLPSTIKVIGWLKLPKIDDIIRECDMDEGSYHIPIKFMKCD